jgi:hypothetical protein
VRQARAYASPAGSECTGETAVKTPSPSWTAIEASPAFPLRILGSTRGGSASLPLVANEYLDIIYVPSVQLHPLHPAQDACRGYG